MLARIPASPSGVGTGIVWRESGGGAGDLARFPSISRVKLQTKGVYYCILFAFYYDNGLAAGSGHFQLFNLA